MQSFPGRVASLPDLAGTNTLYIASTLCTSTGTDLCEDTTHRGVFTSTGGQELIYAYAYVLTLQNVLNSHFHGESKVATNKASVCLEKQ
jgi:hypothetical protein